MKRLAQIFSVLLIFGPSPAAWAADAPVASHTLPSAPGNDINTWLMHATFRVIGPAKGQPGKMTFGTVFIMGIPHKDDPKTETAVLITAAHVLNGIGKNALPVTDDNAPDIATLLVRRRGDDGTYTAYPYDIHIRENGRPLYVTHPSADVAAMYIKFPADVPISGLSVELLAKDSTLTDIDVHPGDEVFCLGFPLATGGPGGFPILRSGHIASFPLTPMETVQHIDLDLFVQDGNSGGPVYFYYANRMYSGQAHLGDYHQGILGLVVQKTNSPLPEFENVSLNFGVIVPAPFIRETIEMLPTEPNGAE